MNREDLIEAMADLDEDAVVEQVKALRNLNVPGLDIIWHHRRSWETTSFAEDSSRPFGRGCTANLDERAHFEEHAGSGGHPSEGTLSRDKFPRLQKPLGFFAVAYTHSTTAGPCHPDVPFRASYFVCRASTGSCSDSSTSHPSGSRLFA